ncbi:MAG: response regulator [Myxococcales bacterium]|nr:response regulator [Myxococcales bacterium]
MSCYARCDCWSRPFEFSTRDEGHRMAHNARGGIMSESTGTPTREERLATRLRLLRDALRRFSDATTDLPRLLQCVVETLANDVGDYCSIRLLSTDGDYLDLHGMHDRDPAALAVIAEVLAADRLRTAEQSVAWRALESGTAVHIPVVDAAVFKAQLTPRWWPMVDAVGIRSLLIAPLRVHGKSIGVLQLVRHGDASGPFDDDDRALVEDLTEQAALAIHNARLYDAAQRELAERRRAEAALARTEQQLRQAQRLDAVGRLAGGVAHDFNNLLSVVLSYAELIMLREGAGSQTYSDLNEVRTAALRAADLTRQLLALSRQQVIQPRVLDLDDVLLNMGKLFQRVLGADIDLRVVTSDRRALVKADPSQIEQVLLNLVVNARDAMAQGGTLTIETGTLDVDDRLASDHLGLEPGRYAVFAVTDSGAGMDPQTMAHIFEPFFTTKEPGAGTGLGLSTVFGIVKQSGGHVWVYSEPGRGTTFKVLLPAAEGAAEPLRADEKPAAARGGTETVLIVDDADAVRDVARTILEHHGYHVLAARNPGEALIACEQFAGPIHLLLTDVVLPQLNGRQLAERLLLLRPTLRVLFMSGHTRNAIVHNGELEPSLRFLPKPLAPEALLKAVRAALDNALRKVG